MGEPGGFQARLDGRAWRVVVSPGWAARVRLDGRARGFAVSCSGLDRGGDVDSWVACSRG